MNEYNFGVGIRGGELLTKELESQAWEGIDLLAQTYQGHKCTDQERDESLPRDLNSHRIYVFEQEHHSDCFVKDAKKLAFVTNIEWRLL